MADAGGESIRTRLLDTWVPVLGAILSMGLGFGPMGSILKCRRNRSLGEVAPEPGHSEWLHAEYLFSLRFPQTAQSLGVACEFGIAPLSLP